MTPEEQHIRAGEAAQILKQPLFEAARADLYEQLRQARQRAPVVATELHTRLVLMEQLADKFFDYFERVLQDGKIAEHYIAEALKEKTFRERGLALFRSFGRSGI